MKKTTGRLASVLLATIMAVVLVLTFTLAGEESYGPIDDLLNEMGSLVVSLENKFIVEQREVRRSKSLEWIRPCADDPEQCMSPDHILLGAYDNQTLESFESIIALEDSIHTKFPLIHLYTAWGDAPEHEFPLTQAKAISSLGSIPVITWEPWLTAFQGSDWENLPDEKYRDKNGLKDIADGVYDAYIQDWALKAKSFGKTVFLRFAHEMNDPYRYPWGPQNNKPEDFIAAWRHIVDIFDRSGVNNISWIWSPHAAYGYFSYYYPGDRYVDWVGVGALNYGSVAAWSQWWSFDEIFGNHYDSLAQFTKPIMITEFGSLAVGGDRSIWYSDALTDLPLKYPGVKSVLFFHFSNDNTTTYQSLNWYIIYDPEVVNAVSSAISLWQLPATSPKR